MLMGMLSVFNRVTRLRFGQREFSEEIFQEDVEMREENEKKNGVNDTLLQYHLQYPNPVTIESFHKADDEARKTNRERAQPIEFASPPLSKQ